MIFQADTLGELDASAKPSRLLAAVALLFGFAFAAGAQTVDTRTITYNGNAYEAFSVTLEPERD